MQTDATKHGTLPMGSGRLIVVALATVLMLGFGSHWVSAKSPGGSGFTSPLATPHAHDPSEHNDQHEDPLAGIIDRDAVTAEVLGITVEELQAARQNGTHLDELIAQLGLDEATVEQAIHDAISQAIQQAVENGEITQDQANLILTPPAPHGQDEHQAQDGTPPADKPGNPGERGNSEQPGRPPHGQHPPASMTPATATPTSESGGGTIPPVTATAVPTATSGGGTIPPLNDASVTGAATAEATHANNPAPSAPPQQAQSPGGNGREQGPGRGQNQRP